MMMLQGVILLMAVTCTSAQFGGFLFGGGSGFAGGSNTQAQGQIQGQDAGGNFIDAAQRNAFVDNFGLNAQAADRTALNAADQQAANERVAASDRFGERLFAANQFGAEEVAQDSAQANVDAIETSKGDRTLSVALIDKQAFDVGNKISASAGTRNAAGAKVGGNTQLAAENQLANDLQAASNAQSVDALQADAAQQAVLGVSDNNLAQSQDRVQASDFFNQQFGQAAGIDQAFGVGGGSLFGGGIFGRRKR